MTEETVTARLDTEARKLLDLRRLDDEAQAKAKKTKKDREEQEQRIHDLLEETNQPSTTLDLGPGYGRWSLQRRRTIFSRVIDKDVALASVEAAGRKDEMFDRTIRKAPANQWLKECLERGEELPDGFDFSETKYITATRKDK